MHRSLRPLLATTLIFVFAYLLPGGGRLTVVGIIMLIVFAIGNLLAHRTRFGSNVYALVGSESSAALMGVPVARTTIAIYALSSFLAGLAGVVFSLYTSAGYPLNAHGVAPHAIAAVVIGGTLLTGGYGFVAGTFIGVMLQGLVQTYIVFDGAPSSRWTPVLETGKRTLAGLPPVVPGRLAGARDRGRPPGWPGRRRRTTRPSSPRSTAAGPKTQSPR